MTTPHPIYGATKAEWELASRLFEPDLLPSFCNPDPSIPRTDKLPPAPKPLNKTPSLSRTDGSVRGISDWTKHVATKQQIDYWSRDTDHGILLICRDVRAIDIDIENPIKAKQIEDYFNKVMKMAAPVRFRPNSGKRTMLVRFNRPLHLKKAAIKVRELGQIEFLADKQQTLLFGSHPSGVRFEIRGDLEAIPTIDFDTFVNAWDAFRKTYDANANSIQVVSLEKAVNVGGALVDDPVLSFLERTGWVSEIYQDGKAAVRCPWENEHTSDTGPSSTVWIPAGFNGGRVGAFKCLHSHGDRLNTPMFLARVGYADEEVQEVFGVGLEVNPAIKALQAVAEAPTERRAQELERARIASLTLANKALSLDKKGNVLKVQANCNVIVRSTDNLVQIQRDAFYEKVQYRYANGTHWLAMDDALITRLMEDIYLTHDVEFPAEAVKRAVNLYASDVSFDSTLDLLNALQWDGKSRIKAFATDVLKMAPSDYATKAGIYMWIATVGRALQGGVKADMMPVLVSKRQGTGKSSVVRAMALREEWFATINLEDNDVELSRQMVGRTTIEIPELKGLESRNFEHIKAWLTKDIEVWRPLYSEYLKEYPRRCLFIGTHNKVSFLSDPTGNRRFLPMYVAETGRYIDWPSLVKDVEQYWAEAVAYIRKFGCVQDAVNLVSEEVHALAEPFRQKATIVDPLTTAFNTFIEAQRHPVEFRVICEALFQCPSSRINIMMERRLRHLIDASPYDTANNGNVVIPPQRA